MEGTTQKDSDQMQLKPGPWATPYRDKNIFKVQTSKVIDK